MAKKLDKKIAWEYWRAGWREGLREGMEHQHVVAIYSGQPRECAIHGGPCIERHGCEIQSGTRVGVNGEDLPEQVMEQN